MPYTPTQVQLWPRLLAAAGEVDTELAEKLGKFREYGASLTLKPDGALALGPGNFEKYDSAKRKYLDPKPEQMRQIMRGARTMPHPWMPYVVRAYELADSLCHYLKVEFEGARALSEGGELVSLVLTLAEAHLAARVLAMVLADAGGAEYSEKDAWHIQQLGRLRHAGDYYEIPAGAWDQQPLMWPVVTPDGAFWVTDKVGVESGHLSTFLATDLARVLGPLQAQVGMREAV